MKNKVSSRSKKPQTARKTNTKAKCIKPKKYTSDRPELFAVHPLHATPEQLQSPTTSDLSGCRLKTYKTKDMLECEVFPIWKTGANLARAPKQNTSRKAQQNLNDRQAYNKFIRKVYYNFGHGDIFLTLTHSDHNLDDKEAARRFKNYIRTVTRRVKSANKTGASEVEPIKYMAVTETTAPNKEGETHTHHHVFINVRDRDLLEDLWKHGKIVESRKIDAVNYPNAPAGLAIYCTNPERKLAEKIVSKRQKGERHWTGSRNLKEPPKPTDNDNKITRRKSQSLAKNIDEIRETFEKMHPGYKVRQDGRDIMVRYSEYVSGAYIYVRMYKESNRNE